MDLTHSDSASSTCCHFRSVPSGTRPALHGRLQLNNALRKWCKPLVWIPVLTMVLLTTPSTSSAQIPVTDVAQITNDNLLQNAMQKFSEEVLGKQYLQKMLSEDAIKKYLADEVLKKQLGDRLLKPMLDQLTVIPGGKAVQSMVDKVVPGQAADGAREFGELKTATREVLDGKHPADNAVAVFFTGDPPANCPKHSGELTDNCLKARKALDAQLQEIRNISSSLESRNNALRDMLKDNNYGSLAELQQKQYTMLTLQTIIANDNMRMQTALAAYQNMRSLYQEKYNEAAQARMNGGGASSLLHSLGRAPIAAAGIAAGRAAAQEIGSNRIFRR